MANNVLARTLAVWIMIYIIIIIILLQSSRGEGESWEAYDSTAYSQCYAKPKELLYEGGIVSNPDFEQGLRGWSANGNCILQLRNYSTAGADDDDILEDEDETKWFVVAANRTAAYNGPAQLLPLLPNRTAPLKFSVSAWLQVSSSGAPGPVLVKATVVLDGGKQYVCAGTVLARSGCWSFLKGGFSLDPSTTSARLYFETMSFTAGMELWLDRASVQPFTDAEWRSHQTAHRELLRRRSVSMRVVDASTGKRLHDADIQVIDTKLGSFSFGSAILQNILNNPPYQKWFVERFNTAVFGNELKWYATERQQGRVDYNVTDAMVAFCEAHNLSVRGHNVVWDDPRFQQPWLKALPTQLLREAVMARVSSVVGRYAGRFLDWDVSNEQLHFSFYEDALGDANLSTTLFLAVQHLDPSAQLFVNDYNTLEDSNDPASSPDAYIAKLRQLQDAGVANLGVGLEAHFTKPNIAYVRSTLDKLATLGFPIWLTELDINVQALNNNITKAASYLEEVLREAFSHPAVQGIVMWAAFEPAGCYRMCLTDANMVNLATGNVVDALLHEWQEVEVLAHSGGAAKWRGPVGTHNISIRWNNNSYYTSLTVSPGKGTQRFVALLSNPPAILNAMSHHQYVGRYHPSQ